MGISSLSTALSGLRINQQQINLISSNVSNVGTEGYTRKILPQSSQVVEGKSVGVVSGIVTRNIDSRLQRDLWTQVSQVAFYDVQSSYLSRVDQFHGAPDANVSVASEIAELQDTFAALANSPTDQFLLSDVVDQAEDTARKINDLADFYTTLRNDAQDEAATTVTAINDLLEQIAELNSQIRFGNISGASVAETQDARDNAIVGLADFIDVSTFSRGDGVIVIQTRQGVELASDTAAELFFRPTPLSPSNAYPNTAAGIFVGDPRESAAAVDITSRGIGGRLEGLITLRDETFPKQTAQLDELSHKLALRFEAQGLRLFTDQSGTIPADTPPDLTTDPQTPVEYVGFSSLIEVNSLVLENPELVRTGTFGATSSTTDANDVIRRIIEYTFGETNFQTATNTDPATSIDLRAGATGGTTLQEWLGVRSNSTLQSAVSLTNFTSVANIVAAGGTDVFGTAPNETDSFIIRFDDPDIGGGPYDVEIDLSAIPAGGVSAAQDLVDAITADPDWANIVTDFGATTTIDSDGRLVLNSRSNIQIVNDPTSPISDQGFAFLGLAEQTINANNPYFDVAVGNNDATRITIDAADTETELIAKLQTVPDLAVEIDADGFLSLRPGNSFSNPDFGGDLRIIGGPFTTQGATLAGTASGRTSIDDGVNIAQALFGTYQLSGSGIIQDLSPITDTRYASETASGSNEFVSFRSANLGPSANIDSEIDLSLSLRDFSQKIINEVSQELSLLEAREADESTLQNLLNQQIVDESGVNLDEELGFLIVVQTAYSASARVINAVEELFDELLNVI